MLKRSRQFIQAYRQAPWRGQMQLIGLVAACVAILALIAGVYLDVTARAATTGRLVQDLQEQRADLEQKIENLQTQLAFIRSVEVMQQRATELGFSPILRGAVTYIAVEGYRGQAVAQLAPRVGSQFASGSRLPAAYTQSLFDWVAQLIAPLEGP